MGKEANVDKLGGENATRDDAGGVASDGTICEDVGGDNASYDSVAGGNNAGGDDAKRYVVAATMWKATTQRATMRKVTPRLLCACRQ